MDWFKRYGIPGAYSMGLTLVWLLVLYPCRIDLSEENTLKIVGGIFVGGFLPFGYLMFTVGQGWYFLWCCCSKKVGRHARARLIDKAEHGKSDPVDISEWATWAEEGIKKAKMRITSLLINSEKETVLSACSTLEAVSRGDKLNLEKEKFVQEWIRKRTDIVVINQAIMAGTIVCTIVAWCLALLPDWSMQPLYLRWLLMPVLFLLLIIIWYVSVTFRINIDIVIAGMFNLRRRQPGKGQASNTVMAVL
jgi:hypothetical protein